MSLFGFAERKTRRLHIPEEWRIKVRKRQKDKCAKCKKPFTLDRRPHFDHKKALALDGIHTLRNIQALCPTCHDNKNRADRAKIAKMKRREKAEFDLSHPEIDLPGFSSPLKKRRRKKKDNPWDLF